MPTQRQTVFPHVLVGGSAVTAAVMSMEARYVGTSAAFVLPFLDPAEGCGISVGGLGAGRKGAAHLLAFLLLERGVRIRFSC